MTREGGVGVSVGVGAAERLQPPRLSQACGVQVSAGLVCRLCPQAGCPRGPGITPARGDSCVLFSGNLCWKPPEASPQVSGVRNLAQMNLGEGRAECCRVGGDRPCPSPSWGSRRASLLHAC